MSEKLKTTPCPTCGHHTLQIDLRMTAKQLGEFSLAGGQMKFSAGFLPWLYCWRPECDFEQQGRYDGPDHAVFPALPAAGDDDGCKGAGRGTGR